MTGGAAWPRLQRVDLLYSIPQATAKSAVNAGPNLCGSTLMEGWIRRIAIYERISLEAVKVTMTSPDADATAKAVVEDARPGGARLGEPPARPKEPPTTRKNQNIHVAPAVLEAAHKDG